MNHAAPEGPLAGKTPVPVRGVVHDPVSDGRRYLLGDAAHLVPPPSARGVNLAASPASQGPSGRAVRVRVPTGIRPPRTRVLIHRCTGPGRQESQNRCPDTRDAGSAPRPSSGGPGSRRPPPPAASFN
ncbi:MULTISPECIES: FAD-dependent monooxygenase [unclassified Streptomyces]|uniref:FAD-dependent monooxygenase n=1 Tax=unclassified Streptomyces TaxID=2593676 RepID=UPI000D141322|nr:FAD-dependent monooxygenase [Streptomyces sp. NRRL F-5630]